MDETKKNFEKQDYIGSDIINLDNIKKYIAILEPNLCITNDICVLLIESLSDYLDDLISVSVKMAKHRKGLYVQKKDVLEALKRYSNVILLDDINDSWY
ncbi:Transcription initiation factor TFIID domain and Histone-fold domain-containing protein [Strongyloides ratti]|uniref:Transcription initiation factor TFIID subunit 12 n=1 Tax=Strongyloides ratti TaxID=34506 RepID=A0A090KZR6_STRRB|nr:Transcription initiation factor TFIID domain and Histone-fold domain-containing protein [Strongyloides ratti]CEF62926.1 Transcription initiation factor TFIID domain and Histone-fold domain-containing protein [Strongyloides ratti]